MGREKWSQGVVAIKIIKGTSEIVVQNKYSAEYNGKLYGVMNRGIGKFESVCGTHDQKFSRFPQKSNEFTVKTI